MSKRLLEFDLLKLIAIFLVLWGHCTQYFLTSPDHCQEPVYRVIYTFHMPLFIMMSGFFAVSSLGKSFRPFLLSKTLQLILPWLSWGSLFYVFLVLLSATDSSYGSHLDHSLWFLKCLFACYLIFYVTFRFCRKIPVAVVVSLAIAFFFPDRYVQTLYPYFLVGALLNHLYDRFVAHVHLIGGVSLVLFAVLSVFNKTDVYWSRTLMSTLLALSGSLSCFAIVSALSGFIRQSALCQFLAKWGQYTLGVYILQSFLLEKLLAQYICLDQLSPVFANLVVNPALSVGLLIICVYISKAVLMNKYSALVFFGKR